MRFTLYEETVGNCKGFLVKERGKTEKQGICRSRKQGRDLSALTFVVLGWCVPSSHED